MTQARKHRGYRTQAAIAAHLRTHGWPYAESTGASRQGADITGTPDIAVEVPQVKAICGRMKAAPEGGGTPLRGLTRSSDLTREGLAMQATRKPIDPASLTESVMRRIWAKTTITPTGCIEWTGAKSANGYGRVGFGGKSGTAVVHRLVLVWALGRDLPPGDVDHLCRNRACIRPDHLDVVTRRENIKRGIATGSDTIRLADLSGICSRGHDMTAPDAWRNKGKGNRMCRLCDNENARQRRARNPQPSRQAVRRYRAKVAA